MTTTAAIDRLVHHASILEPRESIRGEEVCSNEVQKIEERPTPTPTPTPTKGKEDIAEELNICPCVQTTYIDASAGVPPRAFGSVNPKGGQVALAADRANPKLAGNAPDNGQSPSPIRCGLPPPQTGETTESREPDIP